MKNFLVLAGIVALAACALHLGCSYAQPREPRPVLPEADTVFASTRCVTSMLMAPDGELWAATTGGVLRLSVAGVWTKYDRLGGLPSVEASEVSLNSQKQVVVDLPRASATWFEKGWIVDSADAPPNAPRTSDTVWGDQIVQAGPGTFRIRPKDSMEWKDIALPVSRGTHASALLVEDGVLWVALYGDCIYRYDAKKWQRLDIALPDDAREITAMAFDAPNKTLWVGTRRSGIWRYAMSGWRQFVQDDEPVDHNAQYLAMYGGNLYMSTLDDGLQVRSNDGWRQLGGETLSSDAPRHLVEYGGKLYVRHGGGQVDCYDGSNWSLDVFAKLLPRRKAFALAVSNDRLFVAQWGGWSEWDGQAWTHYLQIPELQGLPIMNLLPDGDRIWIGTQSRGVAEYSYDKKKIFWHDERHGLPDDWVTCLLKTGDTVFAGTFVGGLAIHSGMKWTVAEELKGDNVTDLKEDGRGGVYITTRRGVWHRTMDGKMTSLNKTYDWLDKETQALCVTKEGNWIGARTGLFWLKAGTAAP